MKPSLLALLLFVSSCSGLEPDEWLVTKVADGDTVTLVNAEGESRRVRLIGIDAPESDQAFGRESTRYLVDLVHRKTVRLESHGTDRYDRTLGILYLDDTLNVNQQMLRAGMAWRYRYNEDSLLLQLQEKARAAKRGLWQMQNPINPWAYRRMPKRQQDMY